MSATAGMIIAIIIGGVATGIGFVWILITAFRESSSQGLLCMFVPFYEIYYVITRWSDTKKPFIIGLVGVIVLVIGIVALVGGATSGLKSVIGEFMEAGAAGDVEAAYAYWSTGAATEQQIRELVENNRGLFEGYKGLSISNSSVRSTAGITRADVGGAISYTDGRRLPFDARLVKENDVWKLTGIQIGF